MLGMYLCHTDEMCITQPTHNFILFSIYSARSKFLLNLDKKCNKANCFYIDKWRKTLENREAKEDVGRTMAATRFQTDQE